MALEKEKVISKLKSEGIDEKFGEGVNFETEEELDKWVGNAKTLLVKPKALEDYTVDELAEKLKVAAPKEKGLQALADRIRTEASKKKEETKKETETKTQESDEIKDLKTKIEQLLSDHKAEKKEREESKKKTTFDSLFDKYAKGLEDEDKTYVKATLTADSSEDDIKGAVEKFKALMAKRGFEGYGTSSSTQKVKDVSKDSDFSKSIERLKKKEEDKNK